MYLMVIPNTPLFIVGVQQNRDMSQQYPLIPDQAFLFLPPADTLTRDTGSKIIRVIFSGGQPYSQAEKKHLDAFRNYVGKESKGIPLSNYGDDLLLRVLQGADFDTEKALDELAKYYQWEQQTLPLQLSPHVLRHLSSGILYMCGRDYCYRPVIVVDVKRVLDLKIDEAQLLDTLSYFFQFVIENCLIEGQVETWNTITDLGNAGLFKIGGTMLDIIKHLSTIFKARSHRNYILRGPSMVSLLLSMLKGVLNPQQMNKLVFSSEATLDAKDFNFINEYQIEQKYGGKLPNLTTYWPMQPNTHEVSTRANSSHLASECEYRDMYTRGQLKHRKVCSRIINQQGAYVDGTDKRTEQAEKSQDKSIELEKTNNFVETVFPAEVQLWQVTGIPQPLSYFNLF